VLPSSHHSLSVFLHYPAKLLFLTLGKCNPGEFKNRFLLSGASILWEGMTHVALLKFQGDPVKFVECNAMTK